MAPQESSCMGLAGETWGGQDGRLLGGGEKGEADMHFVKYSKLD